MTDLLHDIPDDDLKRRIAQAELLLDQLYTEKYRRLAETNQAQPEWKNFSRNLKRRRNDTTTKGA